MRGATILVVSAQLENRWTYFRGEQDTFFQRDVLHLLAARGGAYAIKVGSSVGKPDMHFRALSAYCEDRSS